jgi:hypothetical protein
MLLREESRFHAPPPLVLGWRLSSMAFPTRRGLPQRRRADEPIVRRPVPELGRHRHPVPSVPRWLDRLYRLCDDKKRGPAVDLVLDAFDDLLLLQDTARCDEILRTVDVERLMVEVLLAILMETFRARSMLTERAGLYRRVEERLTRERPEKVAALLAGMK